MPFKANNAPRSGQSSPGSPDLAVGESAASRPAHQANMDSTRPRREEHTPHSPPPGTGDDADMDDSKSVSSGDSTRAWIGSPRPSTNERSTAGGGTDNWPMNTYLHGNRAGSTPFPLGINRRDQSDLEILAASAGDISAMPSLETLNALSDNTQPNGQQNNGVNDAARPNAAHYPQEIGTHNEDDSTAGTASTEGGNPAGGNSSTGGETAAGGNASTGGDTHGGVDPAAGVNDPRLDRNI